MKRKTISTIIVLALCLSLAVPVLAGEPRTYELSTQLVPDASVSITNVTNVVHDSETLSTNGAYDGEVVELILIYADAPVTVTLLDDISANGLYLGPRIFETSFPDGIITANLYGNNIIEQVALTTGIVPGEDDIVPAGSTFVLSEGTYWMQSRHYPIETVFIVVSGEGETPTQTPNPPPPAEQPSSWAAEQVEAAIAAGLVPEHLQRNYQGSVTRGEVAQMFINLIEQASGQDIDAFMTEKGASVDNNAFTDTDDSAVLAANALGIIQGVGDNRFDPDGVFTRAQIAVIINRVARTLGVDTDGYTHSFTDLQGHWADSELGWPVHAEIIQGVGNDRFDPNGNLTTEMAILITYRALAPLSQ